jgi:hypothetical protein
VKLTEVHRTFLLALHPRKVGDISPFTIYDFSISLEAVILRRHVSIDKYRVNLQNWTVKVEKRGI